LRVRNEEGGEKGKSKQRSSTTHQFTKIKESTRVEEKKKKDQRTNVLVAALE